ncbi:HNH endonuclease [Shigella sonnei]|nr:HNH endonuclease [Shigella sonnei]
MVTLFRKKYPRKSRTTEFLFLILFIVLMTPISPLIFVWIIGKIIEPVIELYNDVVWASFNTLHNKINPYRKADMALTKKQRAELRMKFGGRCAYCGCELGEKWHADHVKPVIRFDGNMLHQERDDISNMVPACHPCNLHKHCSSLEDYRRIISDGRREFLASGKGKALVRMGLVEMKSDPVVFWFEKYQEGATA